MHSEPGAARSEVFAPARKVTGRNVGISTGREERMKCKAEDPTLGAEAKPGSPLPQLPRCTLPTPNSTALALQGTQPSLALS